MATNTPKTMSNRLMTMKFMQRSNSQSTASSPSSTPGGPPSKKVRLSNGASVPSPSTPTPEEQKRQDALTKAAESAGETRWVLSFKEPQNGARPPAMQVRHAGFADIDASDESNDEEEETKPVRKQYGGGLKKIEKTNSYHNDDDSQSSSETSSEEYGSDDLAAKFEAEARKSANAGEEDGAKYWPSLAAKKAPKPIDEDMDLGGLQSLSGPRRSGLSGGNRQDRSARGVCYGCGQNGHYQSDCPISFASRGSFGRGARGNRDRGRGR